MSVDKYLDKIYHKQNYNCAHFAAEVWLNETTQDITFNLSGFLSSRKNREVDINKLRIFYRMNEPCDPCIVLCQNKSSSPHVGIFLRGRVLHITEDNGVRFELLETLIPFYKKIGFYNVKEADYC